MPAAAFVSMVLYPMYEIVIELPYGTCANLNSPLMSENTPFLLPVWNTDAPIIGSPNSSTIVPEQMKSCAYMVIDINETNNVRMIDLHFLIKFITFGFCLGNFAI